ncbi:MAG: potassium channel protein [Syntrophobacterales bacterium]|jgi:voltage-gated potassium channel|nr:potassium channel protein [Syntrophobacterales bacterium]
MVTFRKIAQWTASLAALLVVGSLGFVWLEGWNFFDALYMTVTTLTTVGYGEIHPLDRLGRIYNMVLILAGMGVLLYIVGGLARVLIEGEIRAALGKRKLIKHIKKLKGHFIICGFGRIGEIICRQLKERGLSLVVIETDPALITRLEELGYFFISGDATRDEVLLEAGIERAKGLVAVVSTDADNVYVVLTARSLNPKLLIVARGEESGSEKKLLRAGADKVESPYRMGGQKMAHTILHPTVVTFMELAMKEGVDWSMEEIAVGQTSTLLGVPLKDSGIRQKLDLILVAIKRADGDMLFNPSHDTPILAGDTLIALGLRKNLDALEELVQ